jgi:GAF domain-containing protein
VNESGSSKKLADVSPGLLYTNDGRVDVIALVLHLQDLLVENTDVHAFLTDLAVTTAAQLSAKENIISCGITVIRHKKPVALASSNGRARALDTLQISYGDGPCLTAMRESTIIHIPDVRAEHRWPEYLHAAAAINIGSILAVPLDLHHAAEAVVNLYSPHVNGFTYEDILAAETITGTASKALHLALKISQLSEARDNLAAALDSRTTIDTAAGIIMAQNRCTRDTAFQILVRTSNHRNIKLRALAEDIVAGIAGDHHLATAYEE